jgi:hypothetical protein
MSRKLSPARIAFIAAAALAVGPAPALADGEIPLGDAISGQYHVPDAAQATDAIASAAADAAQYQPEIPTGNSEPVSENGPSAAQPAPQAPVPDPVQPSAAPAAEIPVEAPVQPRADAPAKPPADPPADPPAQPREDPPAKAPAKPTADASEPPPLEPPVELAHAPAVGDLLTAAARAPAQALGANEEAALDGSLELPAELDMPAEVPLDLPAGVPVVPTVQAPAAPPSNTNVSIRIFSPGDNAPVTQTAGGGGSGSAPAPVTWIWNWTWNGAPGCDPGAGANAAPQLGIASWTWNWNWTCGGGDAPGTLPVFSELPQLPGFSDLPGFGSGTGQLVPPISIPAIMPSLPDIAGLAPIAEPVAQKPRERHAPRSQETLSAGSHAAAPPPAPPAPGLLAVAAIPAPTVSQPAADRAPARNSGRDTSRPPGTISAQQAPIGSPLAAAAGAAAAAAGGGAGPAALVTLISLLACFLAGALLEVAGLPRLLLRAARLERPG